MKKIASFLLFCLTLTNAHQYEIYDLNGKNQGLINGELNRYILSDFAQNNHGSLLVKKGLSHNFTTIKGQWNYQLNISMASQIDRVFNVDQDSLNNELWFEIEKNETLKICLNKKVLAWETSLNSSIFNDSCLTIQAPTFTGVEPINLYFPESDSSYKINLVVGMKYLQFENKEVLLGFNEYGDDLLLKLLYNEKEEEDPERFVSITGTYLVDKYPVTNCEITQLLWDSIPTINPFLNPTRQELTENWINRKKRSLRNEKCVTQDSVANTIFLYQAIIYANARSIREGLKPYYILSPTDKTSSYILSKGNFIIGYFGFTKKEDNFIQVSVDYTSNGYRLPFYDEWMIFARGGDKKKKAPWGDESADIEEVTKYARFGTSKYYQESEPVGQLLPNGYGLYDMFGLAWEHVLFEETNPFLNLRNRPSCLKGGDNRVSIHEKKEYTPYWKEINYGFSYSNYNGGMQASFRLIRSIGKKVILKKLKQSE